MLFGGLFGIGLRLWGGSVLVSVFKSAWPAWQRAAVAWKDDAEHLKDCGKGFLSGRLYRQTCEAAQARFDAGYTALVVGELSPNIAWYGPFSGYGGIESTTMAWIMPMVATCIAVILGMTITEALNRR